MLSEGRNRVGLASGLAVLIYVTLATQPVVAAITWTAAVRVSPAYAYSDTQALTLGSSETSGPKLDAVYVRRDTAYQGVYYRRGALSAQTWGTPKRINSSHEHASNPIIWSFWRKVKVAWRTTNADTPAYDPSAPRGIKIRVNSDFGASDAWEPAITYSTPRRVGRIAAAGGWPTIGRMTIVYTDADTGDIIVALSPSDRQVVGQTTVGGDTPDGYEGHPVATTSSAGGLVVAWIDNASGRLVAKVNDGAGWPDQVTPISDGPVWDVAAADGALAWASATGIYAKRWAGGDFGSGGTWMPTAKVAGFSSTSRYSRGYGVAITSPGRGRYGIAWTTCRQDCTANGSSIRWRESTDWLVTFQSPELVASSNYGPSRLRNEYPSIYLTRQMRRFVIYNATNASRTLSASRVLIERGTGAP